MKLIFAAIKPARGSASPGRPNRLPPTTWPAGPATRLVWPNPSPAKPHSSPRSTRRPLRRPHPPHLILLDPRGKPLTSEGIAAHLGAIRDTGVQTVVLAIGPADGWSADARARASLVLSLGSITLPHELARVVLAEQIYRALTILAGHPYHSGH